MTSHNILNFQFSNGTHVAWLEVFTAHFTKTKIFLDNLQTFQRRLLLSISLQKQKSVRRMMGNTAWMLFSLQLFCAQIFVVLFAIPKHLNFTTNTYWLSLIVWPADTCWDLCKHSRISVIHEILHAAYNGSIEEEHLAIFSNCLQNLLSYLSHRCIILSADIELNVTYNIWPKCPALKFSGIA